MFIGVLGPIATNDLLSESAQLAHKQCPKGRAGAPLVSKLIQEYIRRGHKVLAITIDPHMSDDEPPYVYTDQSLTYIIAPSRHHTFRPNGKRLGRTFDFFRFERNQMLALLRQYKPDVVHAHWTYEFALAALSYNPNALITVHDNALVILSYIRTLERVFMYLLARFVFRKGRFFTAVSPYMAESISKWVSSEVTVVPNPVTMPDESSSIDRTGLSGNVIISMVVNGWEKRKNSQKALLAFKAVQKLHPDAVLWAIGTAFEPDTGAEAFCQQHQIPNVILFGQTPHAEVLKKIAQSTLLLHTSLEESFGMVLAEAMSYGVPVVAGKDSGAVPWVVEDGGLLVDVTNIEAIAEAINKLISNPKLYNQLSANAIQIVKTRFPIEEVADQYLSLYKQ